MVPREADREQHESAFTPILRDLFTVEENLESVVFVDNEGECVDYCSSTSPFSTKLLAAHAVVLRGAVADGWRRIGGGAVQQFHIRFALRSLLLRPVTDEYSLVLSLDGEPGREVHEAIERACILLREESVFARPSWEPSFSSVPVETRRAKGWEFAPRSFLQRGKKVKVTAVIGRWEEPGRICFRARTSDGREVTLEHSLGQSMWRVFTES